MSAPSTAALLRKGRKRFPPPPPPPPPPSGPSLFSVALVPLLPPALLLPCPCSDTARLDVAIAELQNVAADDLLVGVPIAVAVNARGAAAGAAAVADLTSRLEPSKLFAGRPWRLEACDASDARDAGLKRLVEFLAAETREI